MTPHPDEKYRTFKVGSPLMEGNDIGDWQDSIREEFARMDIDCPIERDNIYGPVTRAFTASLCHALGMVASHVMREGVTPSLRIRIRNRKLTPRERERMKDRVDWRRRLRARYNKSTVRVHKPVDHIITDSWGYHPGLHDGIDVICKPEAPVYAMVKAKVIDARSGGWWGKAPSGDVTKGDGIVQLEVLEDVGPFKKGHHIGYGHCEQATVRVGDVVEAGDVIAKAGLAVAWHIHLMYNNGSTNRGVGNIDPRDILEYAKERG